MKLPLIIFSSILYLATAARIRCESFCRFRSCINLLRTGLVLQRENRVAILGVPFDSLVGTTCILNKRGKLKLISNVTGGEATVSKVFSLDPYVPVSEYLTDIVDPPIPPNFFFFFPNPRNGRQAIGRLPPKGNQDELLDEVCVRQPISSYNILRENGSIRRSVKSRGANSCIGFRTKAVRLLVVFGWLTSNDFDLRLEEPNGFEINRFGGSSSSPNGGHLTFDVGASVCQADSGNEKIRYLREDSNVESGTYTIRIDHLRQCSSTSPYTLRVFFDGEIILDEFGEITELGESVLVRKFTIPSMDEATER